MEEHDGLIRASRYAIARAKRRGSDEVTPDDLLSGVLQSIARFGIVLLGPLTIDMEAIGEDMLEEADAAGPKVAYSQESAAVFDRAAVVARRDRSPRIEAIHLLAAFACEENGLMGRLRSTYNIDASAWRAALAHGHPTERRAPTSTQRPAAVQELLSPDEAADLLGVHTQTVRGYIRSGKLIAHRLAGERAVRIRRQDLIDLLEPYDPD